MNNDNKCPVTGISEPEMSSASKCPVMGGTGKVSADSGTSSQDWWPNQLNLKILHQNPPTGNPMGAEFNYAEKFKELDLVTKKARQTTSPIIDVPGLQFECRIVHKSAMDPQFLSEDYTSLYPEKDYHTLYFGEILECYECFQC